MMKKILILTGYVSLVALVYSCKDKQSPGRAYMPDMAYSVAYETYAPAQERLNNSSVSDSGGTKPYFNARPVEGTIARGDMAHYPLVNDSVGYAMSANIQNPLQPAAVDLKEAERLYLINCAICHGAKLDGNGPLYNDGNGPYSAAPKNLVGDEIKKMAPGTIYHSMTYGKGQMGSYASQLTSKQRWMIVSFIKGKQFPAGAPAATDSTKTITGDSTTVAKAK